MGVFLNRLSPLVSRLSWIVHCVSGSLLADNLSVVDVNGGSKRQPVRHFIPSHLR